MTRDEADLSDLHDAATPEDLEDLALGDDYALNAEYVEMVIDAADRGDDERLRELVGALRSEDVADLMGLSVETIKTHRADGAMPDPDYVVDQKPLWRRETIDGWIARRAK